MLRSLILNRAQRSAAAGFPALFTDAAAPCALGLSRARCRRALRDFWRLAPGAWPLLLLAVSVTNAAILPDQIGGFTKGQTKTLAAPDAGLDQEFGFISAEQAPYTAPGKRFTATAWRLHDSTGALAFFEAQRPVDATPAKLAALFAKTPDGAIFAYGNYVFQLTGAVPEQKDLELLFAQLPQLDRAPLPALIGNLPQDGLIPESERYILGPTSLARFEPRIAPSLAAFHLDAEAQLGRYRTPKGDLTLVIFSYPTPNMARERQAEFLKMPGTIAKRSGPLVAVVVQPPDPDAAERILAGVRYEGNLTSNEKVPVNQARAIANLFLNIFTLSGILIALSIIVGIGFGGFRVLHRKMRKNADEDGFLLLRIGDK
jgi:Family of unknown function (DUF6599)